MFNPLPSSENKLIENVGKRSNLLSILHRLLAEFAGGLPVNHTLFAVNGSEESFRDRSIGPLCGLFKRC